MVTDLNLVRFSASSVDVAANFMRSDLLSDLPLDLALDLPLDVRVTASYFVTASYLMRCSVEPF